MKLYEKIYLKSYKAIQEYAIIDIEQKLTLNPNYGSQLRIKHDLPEQLLEFVNIELESYGISNVYYAQSYLRKRNTKQEIHIDGDKELISLAINIPLRGTTNSKFNWYDGTYDITKKQHNDIVFYAINWKSKPMCVATLELNEPYIIRVDVPHNAESSINEDRWIFTMRFKNNPKHHTLLC